MSYALQLTVNTFVTDVWKAVMIAKDVEHTLCIVISLPCHAKR
jgi:hypothetical protein